jgi:hypothetical protein
MKAMEPLLTTHIPFAQLDLVQLFALRLAVTLVLEPNNAWPPTAAELIDDLKSIWEELQLTPADLVDFGELADRLEPHLLKGTRADRFNTPVHHKRRRRGRKAI